MIVLKIAIGLMAFVFIWNIATDRYKDKYPTILYFGLKGSGKSTILTKWALRYLKKGHTVYSNYYVPGCIMYDPKRLGTFCVEPDSLVLCDEIALVFNNRNYSDFPENVNKFITLQRKFRCTFVCATQIFDSFDKKIRGQISGLYQVKCIGRVIVVARQILKDIKPTESGEDITGNYHYAGLLVGTQFAFVPRYVEYFTSFDPPQLPALNSSPLPISDLQSQHLKGSKWLSYQGLLVVANAVFLTCKELLHERKIGKSLLRILKGRKQRISQR